MEKINFDSDYISSIINGRKKTTIRKGIRSYPVGRLVELTANGERFAFAKIKKVVVKRVSELTDEDAIVDGFQSRKDLIRALKRIYGDIDEKEFVTIVHFELVE